MSAEKTAEPKKKMSRVNLKKDKKADLAAQKKSAKTKVRLNRAALRASKRGEGSDDKMGKGSGKKLIATRGQAPDSTRITPPRGPCQKLASQTTFAPKYYDGRDWLIVDAAGQTVGRLASELAKLLRGKHKPSFTPNNDAGDFVVVVNADKVKFSRNKEETKKYFWHTQHIGGIKEASPAIWRERGQADRIVQWAVKGMLPKNSLGRAQLKKLKVYTGAEHPHAAQNPQQWQPKF